MLEKARGIWPTFERIDKSKFNIMLVGSYNLQPIYKNMNQIGYIIWASKGENTN